VSAPEVSVVLSVRDGEATIAASLESVLSQEGVELELIAVDDASTDATPDLLAACAARDPRVRVVRGAGEGLTAALRLGCAAARAPWIARQDARDESLPGRLRRQLDATRDSPRLALVSCFTECLAPGGELLYVEKGRCEPDVERPLFDGDEPAAGHVGPTSHGSTLFRRELYERVGGYRLEFPLAQDWDLWLRLADVGSYRTVGAVLYRRRLAADSSSFRLLRLQREFGELATEAARCRRSGEPETAVLERAGALAAAWRAQRGRSSRRALALAYYHFGEVLRRRGAPEGRAYLARSLKIRPTLLRAWVRWTQVALGALASDSEGARARR